MSFVVFGINHRTSPLSLLEKESDGSVGAQNANESLPFTKLSMTLAQ